MEILDAGLGGHGIERAGDDRRAVCRERLEHAERGRHGNVFRDQVANERGDGVAGDVDCGDRTGDRAVLGADIRLFVADEVTGDHDAVLEIIDTERRGLAERHGAEVPRDLEIVAVRLGDRGPQLRTRDIHVQLERRRAVFGPVANHVGRVGRR